MNEGRQGFKNIIKKLKNNATVEEWLFTFKSKTRKDSQSSYTSRPIH